MDQALSTSFKEPTRPSECFCFLTVLSNLFFEISGPSSELFFILYSNSPHNPFWDIVKTLLVIPSKKQIQCQYPKRVLLDIGEQHTPYDWGPSIVETQILRVGSLFILIAPGEFTTMSGRRIKKAVSDSIIKNGLLPEGVAPIVQISGPSNTYGHYIATAEEYEAQRYEGASTLFGPHTLEAYIDIYSNTLIPALKAGAPALPKGRLATDNFKKAISLQTKVVYDNVSET